MRLFGDILHYTGCRLSETLELTPERIDLSEGRVLTTTAIYANAAGKEEVELADRMWM